MDPDYPWPDKYKAEEHGFLAFLSKFKDVPNKKAKPVTLPFERPVQELEAKIIEVWSFTSLSVLRQEFYSLTIDQTCRFHLHIGAEWMLRPVYLRLIVYHICAGVTGARIG